MKIKRNEIVNVTDLPGNFINRIVKKKYIEFTDMKITKANSRLKEVMSDISIISQNIVEELMCEIVKDISSLFMISEAISILDLLCCFAYNSGERKYIVPHFSNKMVLQRSRHPILETTIKNFVPNEISNAQKLLCSTDNWLQYEREIRVFGTKRFPLHYDTNGVSSTTRLCML